MLTISSGLFARRSAAAFCLCLCAGALVLLPPKASAEQANHSAENSRGVYLYSLNVAVEKSPSKAPQVIQALEEPGTDGITLVQGWQDVEPSHGIYVWNLMPRGQSLFDQWLAAAVGTGKKINLAIRAGKDTPCWLFRKQAQSCGPAYTGSYAGAKAWRFEVSAHQGLADRGCQTVDMATPWDPVFLAEWDSMLAAVSSHLKDVGAYESVDMVRLTGINRTTDEFRLPEEILPSPCTDSDGVTHTDTNSISTWLAAGYRPSLLTQAWNAITTSFLARFPDKTFNVPIIPIDTGQGQFPFPEIDEGGCVYTSIVMPSIWNTPQPIPDGTCPNKASGADSQLHTVLFNLLGIAANKFPRHLIVEFENLANSQTANSTVVEAASELGTMSAFMTNNYFAALPGAGAGAACGGGFIDPQPCSSSAAYLALIDIGVYPCLNATSDPFCPVPDLKSTFIEVFAPDMLTFPDAVLQAHIQLHRSH
jgi:hypothetical protein